MNKLSKLVVCTLLFASALVRADSISYSDPKIVIGRGTGSMAITMLTFGVTVNANGGGILDFDNATGKIWTGLIFTITFPNAEAAKAAILCSSTIFSSCTKTRHGKVVTAKLTDGEITFCNTTSPCPLDSEFFINLNDPGVHGHNGKGGWKGDVIEAQAVTTPAVPEPDASLLLVTGLGGICGIWILGKQSYRRKRLLNDSLIAF
jgi:hypothetical protein